MRRIIYTEAFTSEYELIWSSWKLSLNRQSAGGPNGFAYRDLRILWLDKEMGVQSMHTTTIQQFMSYLVVLGQIFALEVLSD